MHLSTNEITTQTSDASNERAPNTKDAPAPVCANPREVVLDAFEPAAKVALPAIEVPVNRTSKASSRVASHRANRLRSRDRAAALGDGVENAGIDEPGAPRMVVLAGGSGQGGARHVGTLQTHLDPNWAGLEA